MNIVIISALGNDVLKKCIDSMLETSSIDENDIFIIREREFREKTLNKAIRIIGYEDDVLFVGDDIIFTSNWMDRLIEDYHVADILGMSTLYPNSNIVQDSGYDIIEVDGMITTEAKYRNEDFLRIKGFSHRICDATCGCFMLIKKHVFKKINLFNIEGANRWGELLFCRFSTDWRRKICCHRIKED